MRNKSDSPSLKRPKPALGSIRYGGFGITKSSAQGKPSKDVSMTPDTFERSQARIKKKVTIRHRRSLYDGDNTTQIHGDDTQFSQADTYSELEHTPITISQISAIDPSADDTLTATFRKNKSSASNETLEMAVKYARGEPDGAERSFTRKQFSKMALAGSDNDNADQGGSDVSMEGIEEGEIDEEMGSPSKKAKVSPKAVKKTPGKVKKASLKIPFKQAAKKLKTLKSGGEVQKTKKKVNKNFEALPDETAVPKTPNQTWKEKKQQRKMVKNNYDLISCAKKAWEDLRRADLPEAKRKKICDDLMKLVVGKVKELAVVHDSARVIQCLVQYGSAQQREIIFQEVKSELCELCKLKYAKYVVRKLIHYGSKEMKNEVFKCFQGQVRKLIRHKEASDIIEYAFNDYATAPQRLAILEEFYGPTFSLFKDRANQSLDQIMAEQPEKKDMVIRSMREALVPLIDKELLAYSLVHKVFYDFFIYADDKTKKEMIEGLREHLPNFLHTRDGARVAMKCIWSGSVKDRKIMVKSLKTHVVKVCKEEHGHFLLLSIFDSVDDTVLVQKVILDELVKSIDDVVQNQYGRKVLLYMLCPRDPHHFHPDVVKILQEGDSNPTSKKDKTVRATELRTHVSSHLVKYLKDNALAMMSDSHLTLLVKEIISHASGDVAPAMRAIAKLVAQPCNTADGAINMVEHPACHIALKKIIAHDKIRMSSGETTLFSTILLEELPKSAIKVWAASNRGCFVIVSLLEVGSPDVSATVRSYLEPVHKSLKKMGFKGAELLLKKLDLPMKDREYMI